jgi:hypothetical protein
VDQEGVQEVHDLDFLQIHIFLLFWSTNSHSHLCTTECDIQLFTVKD